MVNLFAWLDERRGWGVIFIRVVFGFWLVYGTQDNIFDSARMVEFERFIAKHGFPVPVAGAYVSAYAQFTCGILYTAGAAIRPPLAMLAVACFLLFNGAGPLSVDERLTARRE